ncbi:MAG: hypothetical protein HOP03_00770 [Lysobacter sp.]|nr:hypothetical protein [Lysobacter sp.]
MDDTLHALAEALAVDDIDRALTLGLLDARPEAVEAPCADCRKRAQIVIAARDERLRALGARERYRARQARLSERADARARKRAGAAVRTSAVAATSALPPAVAAALARAKAKVAAKRPPE